MVEEGFFNQYAQFAGESAANLKFYSLTDMQRSSENMESSFMGGFIGTTQTALTKGVGYKNKIQQYKEQQQTIKDLKSIGGINTSEQLKKTLEISLDAKNIQTVNDKINTLLSEGKTEEASKVADMLLLHKSVKAASTGTTEVLNKAFTELLNNDGIEEQDKQHLEKAIRFNNQVADIHDFHILFNNKEDITRNRANKLILENNKQELLSILPQIQQDYDARVDAVIRRDLSKLPADSETSYEDLYESKKNSTKLNPEEHPVAMLLDNINESVKQIQEVQDNLDEKYNYMSSNKGQREYVKKAKEERKKSLINEVSPENVEEVKESLKQEDELTSELNSQINQKVESTNSATIVENYKDDENIPNVIISEDVSVPITKEQKINSLQEALQQAITKEERNVLDEVDTSTLDLNNINISDDIYSIESQKAEKIERRREEEKKKIEKTYLYLYSTLMMLLKEINIKREKKLIL